MKKWLSVLICLCMVMALVVGCSSDTGEGSNSGSTSSDATSSDGGEASEEAPSGETSTLTITYIDTNNLGEAATYYTWINDVYENWDKKDQVELDIQPVVAPDSDYFTRIQLQMSDASTSPDIVYDDSFQIAADVGAGYLSNLDDYLAGWERWNSGAFIEALKAGVTGEDGSIYAVPAGTDGRGLWYNRQVMVDAGVIASKDEEWVPETWDDVLDAARAIKENCEGVTPFFAQVANANAESTSMNTYEMIYYGTGEELYDKTSGLWTIRSQGILDSLTFLQTMYTEELSYDLGTSLDVNSANTAIEDLSTYELGIFLCGTWIPSNYLDTGMFP